MGRGGGRRTDPNNITHDDAVIRKVPPYHIHDCNDGSGQRRVSKSAFSGSNERTDPEKGMSVDLWSKLVELGVDPTGGDYLPEVEILMILKVSDLNGLGLTVVRRAKNDNKAHCNVLGIKSTDRKKLLDAAEWLRRPNDVIK